MIAAGTVIHLIDTYLSIMIIIKTDIREILTKRVTLGKDPILLLVMVKIIVTGIITSKKAGKMDSFAYLCHSLFDFSVYSVWPYQPIIQYSGNQNLMWNKGICLQIKKLMVLFVSIKNWISPKIFLITILRSKCAVRYENTGFCISHRIRFCWF